MELFDGQPIPAGCYAQAILLHFLWGDDQRESTPSILAPITDSRCPFEIRAYADERARLRVEWVFLGLLRPLRT